MEKQGLRKLVPVLIVLVIFLVVSASLASAAIYDDFTADGGITQSDLWDTSLSNGLFSMGSDGLYISASGLDVRGAWVSTMDFGTTCRIILSFTDFSASLTTGAQTTSSFVPGFTLGFGSGDNLHQVILNEFYAPWSTTYSVGTARTKDLYTYGSAISTTGTGGRLGFIRNGNTLEAWYNSTLAYDDAWVLIDTYDDFTDGSIIRLGVTTSGFYPGYASGDVSLRLLSLEYDNLTGSFTDVPMGSTVPLPPGLILLAPGVAGAIAFRRRLGN